MRQATTVNANIPGNKLARQLEENTEKYNVGESDKISRGVDKYNSAFF
jgi:hypothetical protein